MSKFRVDPRTGNGQGGHGAGPAGEETDESSTSIAGEVATIGIVAVGVAILSAELLPGVAIGVGAAMAPKYLPKLSERLEPLFESAVRGAYKFSRKARFAVSEMQERVDDIKAEVKAEEASAETVAAEKADLPRA